MLYYAVNPQETLTQKDKDNNNKNNMARSY